MCYGRPMRKFTIPVLVLVCLTTLIGIAAAVRPSGPGQSTKANSLSVAVASDQVLPVSISTAAPAPSTLTALTPADTDAAPGCSGDLFVGIPDAGTLTAYGCGNDASVAFNGLGSGQVLRNVCMRQIVATGTAARGLVCISQ